MVQFAGEILAVGCAVLESHF